MKACLINLTLHKEDYSSQLWISLLSSCLGYILPNPYLKKKRKINFLSPYLFLTGIKKFDCVAHQLKDNLEQKSNDVSFSTCTIKHIFCLPSNLRVGGPRTDLHKVAKMTESSVRVASAPKTIADVLLPESGEESAMPVIRICDLHLCREPLAQPPTMDTACPHPDAMAVYVAVVRQSKTSLAQPPPSDAATKNQVAVRTPYKSPASSEPPPSLNLQTTKEQSGQDKKVECGDFRLVIRG
uniref:Uncharacterized protein n=1 Tax=Romanomermis culicivorax TaxID=13658 RepID=A0A915K1P3_ROMCU